MYRTGLFVLALMGVMVSSGVTAATIMVDTLSDSNPAISDGLCSLREALAAADNNQAVDSCTAGTVQQDLITFDPSLLPPSELTPFAIILDGARLALQGGDVHISGPPSRPLTIDAQQMSNVFDVALDGNASVTLDNLELTGGQGGQGAIRLASAAEVTLRKLLIHNNSASDRGGAVGGNLNGSMAIRIEQSELRDNHADSFGGAIGLGLQGDMIMVELDITDSIFAGNQTGQFGAGGAIYLASFQEQSLARVSVIDSAFGENLAGGDGGAISAAGLSSTTTMDITIQRSLFLNNAAQSGSGGAARISSANSVIENSTWIGNQSESTSGALRLNNFSNAADRSLSLLGNTFFENRSQGIAGNTEHAFVQFHPTAASTNVMLGNLFVSRSDTTFDGCLIGNAAFADDFGYNMSNDSSCINAPSDVLADPLRIVQMETGDVVLTSAIVPQVGSPVIDAWPQADCNLSNDFLAGPRPLDGDDDIALDCDIGAWEAPTGKRLVVAVVGMGKVRSVPAAIDCQPDCLTAFPIDSAVSLIASARSGHRFSDWNFDCSGTNAQCDLTMDQRQRARANFLADPEAVEIEVTVSGPGVVVSDPAGIYCPASCSTSLSPGPLSLMAIPDPGAAFTWSGACAGTSGPICQFDLTANDQADIVFEATDFALQVTASGTGSGEVTSQPAGIACAPDCSENYPAGTSVTLTASPQPGDVFAGWSGACSGSGSCVVVLNADASVDAEFQQRKRLTVTVSGQGRVTDDSASIDCPGLCTAEFDQFSPVTLSATAEPGWLFDHWQGCTAPVAAPQTCITQMLIDREVDAVFVPAAELIFADGFE